MEKESALNRFAFLNLGIISKQEPEKAPLCSTRGFKVSRAVCRAAWEAAGLAIEAGRAPAGAGLLRLAPAGPRARVPPAAPLYPPHTMRSVRALSVPRPEEAPPNPPLSGPSQSSKAPQLMPRRSALSLLASNHRAVCTSFSTRCNSP